MDKNFLVIALFLLVVCVATGLLYIKHRERAAGRRNHDDFYDDRYYEDEEEVNPDNTQNEDIMSKKNKPNRWPGGGNSYGTSSDDDRYNDRSNRSGSGGYYDKGGYNRNNERSNSPSDYEGYGQSYQRSSYQGYGQRQSTVNVNSVDETRPSTVAIIYRSELDYISRCIHDYPNIETGGQLFGFLTENGSPVVCYAIGPGPRANHQPAFFNQDTRYLQDVFDEINQRWGLRYIGEWHSHHQLGLARPSGHDAQTIVNGIRRSNFRHFLLCIGNCDDNYHSTLNAFTFHLNDPYHFIQAPWKIIERESPYRPLIDKELDHMLEHPRFEQARHGELFTVAQGGRQAVVIPDYSPEYWLNNKANNLVLKQILDFLNAEEPNSKVRPMLDEKKHVHLIVERPGRQEEIFFGEYFPATAPRITNQAKEALEDPEGWAYTDDIFKAFSKYYRGALRAERQRMEQKRQAAARALSDRISSPDGAIVSENLNAEEPTQAALEALRNKYNNLVNSKMEKAREEAQAQEKPQTSPRAESASASAESTSVKTPESTSSSPVVTPTEEAAQPKVDSATEETENISTTAEVIAEPSANILTGKDSELEKKVEEIRKDETNKNIVSSMATVEDVKSDDINFGAEEVADAHSVSEEAFHKETIPSLKDGIEETYGESDQIIRLDEVEGDNDLSVTNTHELIPESKPSVSYNERVTDELDQAKK